MTTELPERMIITDQADIPAFATEAEEQAWWETHKLDTALYTDEDPNGELAALIPVRPGKRPSVAISLRLDPITLQKLRVLAADQGIGYQTLIKRWVDQAIAHANPIAPPLPQRPADPGRKQPVHTRMLTSRPRATPETERAQGAQRPTPPAAEPVGSR